MSKRRSPSISKYGLLLRQSSASGDLHLSAKNVNVLIFEWRENRSVATAVSGGDGSGTAGWVACSPTRTMTMAVSSKSTVVDILGGGGAELAQQAESQAGWIVAVGRAAPSPPTYTTVPGPNACPFGTVLADAAQATNIILLSAHELSLTVVAVGANTTVHMTVRTWPTVPAAQLVSAIAGFLGAPATGRGAAQWEGAVTLVATGDGLQEPLTPRDPASVQAVRDDLPHWKVDATMDPVHGWPRSLRVRVPPNVLPVTPDGLARLRSSPARKVVADRRRSRSLGESSRPSHAPLPSSALAGSTDSALSGAASSPRKAAASSRSSNLSPSMGVRSSSSRRRKRRARARSRSLNLGEHAVPVHGGAASSPRVNRRASDRERPRTSSVGAAAAVDAAHVAAEASPRSGLSPARSRERVRSAPRSRSSSGAANVIVVSEPPASASPSPPREHATTPTTKTDTPATALSAPVSLPPIVFGGGGAVHSLVPGLLLPPRDGAGHSDDSSSVGASGSGRIDLTDRSVAQTPRMRVAARLSSATDPSTADPLEVVLDFDPSLLLVCSVCGLLTSNPVSASLGEPSSVSCVACSDDLAAGRLHKEDLADDDDASATGSASTSLASSPMAAALKTPRRRASLSRGLCRVAALPGDRAIDVVWALCERYHLADWMSFALVDEAGVRLGDDAVLVAKGGQAAAAAAAASSAASSDAKPNNLFAPQRLRLTKLSTVRTALELRDEIKQLRQRLTAVTDTAASEQQRRVVAEREAQRLRVALRQEREASAQHRKQSAAAAAAAAASASNVTRSGSADGLPDSWAVQGSDVLLAEKLSEGTTADVYAGTFRGQTVAVKVIKATMVDEHRAAFAQECSIMSSLRSPHTVFFFGAVTEPTVMLVFEYCARGSLYDVLNDRHLSPGLSWPLALSLLRQCALGVQSLHEWKPTIVHRDLKSGNLMVNEDFTLKIGDFGIAQLMDPAAATVTEDESEDDSSGAGLTSEHTMRGTFAYVAPEVYHGEEFTPSSDVYSLGIIAWEVIHRLVTGSYDAPFVREHTISHAFQIVLLAATRGVRPTLPPKTPPCLANLTQKCWAHEQATRPTAAQIIVSLDAALADYEAAPKAWDRLCKGAKRSRLDVLFAKAGPTQPMPTSPALSRSAQVRELVADGGRVRSLSVGAKK